MEIKRAVVHEYEDKVSTLPIPMYESMVSTTMSAPQLLRKDVFSARQESEDDSVFYSEDVEMDPPASVSAAAAAGNEPLVQVIQIPTENSLLPEDCDQYPIKVRVTTPVIRVDDVDEGVTTCLRTLDVEDDDSNAVVRVTWECGGTEVKTTVMTPVADLINDCLDLAEAQVEAVPLDPQFYNQWARLPREKDPDRDLASGPRRPISLRMLPATGSLKSYSLLNAIVRDKTSPIESYGSLNQIFKTSSSTGSLPTVVGGAAGAGTGASYPSNGRISPSAGRRSGVPAHPAPQPPSFLLSDSSPSGSSSSFRCRTKSFEEEGEETSSTAANRRGANAASSSLTVESRRRGRRRRGDSGDDPMFDVESACVQTSTGNDVRFFLESLDASESDQESSENLFARREDGGGEGRRGGGGVERRYEPVACYAMPRRCRSWICSTGFSLPPSSAPSSEIQRQQQQQQQPLLPLNMASLLFSQDIDMRDSRYRYGQFGNKRPVPAPVGIAKPFKPREGLSGSCTPQAKVRADSKGKDGGNGGSSASAGGPADKPEVTNVEFIDLSEVRKILLKENRKTAAQMGGSHDGKGLAGPGGRSESYSATAASCRSLPISIGSAFRPYGAHRPFAKLMPSGHFLTVGVPMNLCAVKTSAAE